MDVFEWTRMAMGLVGADGYFQQTLALYLLGGLLYVICELYIDDILVYASSNDEFVTRIRQIFDRMRTYNFILNPDKCSFGMTAVEFVGHLFIFFWRNRVWVNYVNRKKTYAAQGTITIAADMTDKKDSNNRQVSVWTPGGIDTEYPPAPLC